MKIVIDIDDDIAHGIIEGNNDEPRNIVRSFQATIADAIQNGTILPKGHGRLIDVQDAADDLMEYKEIGIFGNYDKLTIRGCIDRIENHVKPIIEADKVKRN
jgi:hypothetical protein